MKIVDVITRINELKDTKVTFFVTNFLQCYVRRAKEVTRLQNSIGDMWMRDTLSP